MSEASIIDACRTPRGIGKPGKGALAHLHPQRVGATVLAAIAGRNDLDTSTVDDVIWGTSNQALTQAADLGRMAALHLRALHPQPHQGICADAIATLEGIGRPALDELALASQQRAARAIAEGRFDRSLVPVRNDDGSVALDREEHPRPGTTLEGLQALAPAFAGLYDVALDTDGTSFKRLVQQKYPDLEIEHVHHAGNSSGVVDGAAAVLWASPGAARRNGWTPRARLVAMANVGDDPTLMLNAPVPAARKVLARAELSVEDIDLFEVNEAFAVVVEKFVRDLAIDRERINVNGGAIALGHPIGATGAMLIGTALDELERTGGRYGLITMCAAGGMAPAIVIERIEG